MYAVGLQECGKHTQWLNAILTYLNTPLKNNVPTTTIAREEDSNSSPKFKVCAHSYLQGMALLVFIRCDHSWEVSSVEIGQKATGFKVK
jgi:hypothetical protein